MSRVKPNDRVYVTRSMFIDGQIVEFATVCRVREVDDYNCVLVEFGSGPVWRPPEHYSQSLPGACREYNQFVSNVGPRALESMLPNEERWRLNTRVYEFEMSGQKGSVVATFDRELFDVIKARLAARPVTDDTTDYDALPSTLGDGGAGGEG